VLAESVAGELLARDEARRIAVEYCEAAGAVASRLVRRGMASAPPYFRQSPAQNFESAGGITVGTFKRCIWGSVFAVIVVCFYWIAPSAYSIKYALSADKIRVDTKPTDCDFWHAPLGEKGCHYKRVVIGRHLKDIREIRPGESTSERFESVLITWVKKTD
jgi:hypothetical protein